MENRRHRPLNETKLQLRRAGSLAVKPASASMLITSMHPLQPSSTPSVAVQWLTSGKNLDFCLLAFCSCVLAILCHQTVHLSPSPSAPASQLAASSRVLPADLDFTVKAGLFTSSQSRSEEDKEVSE